MRTILAGAMAAMVVVSLLAPWRAAHGADAGRGGYLVGLLGCGRCHTEGYLTGNQPSGVHLAGSRIGIAHGESANPAIAYPSNLTPDPRTGIGGWTRADIIRAMTHGIGAQGHERLTVMPWVDYRALNDVDLEDIAEYLLALPPIEYAIPEPVPEGTQATTEYVRFGVYRFSPHTPAGQ